MIDTDRVLDAVGEANRRLLLELLGRSEESTVSELVDASGLRQPQVSKHLKVLAEVGLVVVRADGRFRRYRLDGRGLRAAHDWFASFEDVWQARFDALDELVSTDDRTDVPSMPHLTTDSITHPADTHPADTHPADTHPTDTHPADTHPTDMEEHDD